MAISEVRNGKRDTPVACWSAFNPYLVEIPYYAAHRQAGKCPDRVWNGTIFVCMKPADDYENCPSLLNAVLYEYRKTTQGIPELEAIGGSLLK